MAEQPTGTVTMLFTDIEGSTRLLERLGPERYRQALDLHRTLMREAVDRHGGYEVDVEGDAFFVAFSSARDAVAAAVEAQQRLGAAEWSDEGVIRVRMGLHTGEPLAAPPKYVGLDVHKAARIMAAGHGGQVLLSAATRRLIGDHVSVLDLGTHRLKDLTEPEPLYQLLIDGSPRRFPALKTLGNRPTNLPVVATAFLGRERELRDVHELLIREETRVLTLTGPGGIGKTRLGLQAAADAVESFADGVYWVPLAAVRDAALVIPAVAEALGLREEPGEALSETVRRFLRDVRLLLVLDNFEQVIDAAAEIAMLVRAAPRLSVLVTSREVLRVQGEHVFDVPALAVPGAHAGATESEAVQLFVERARSVDSGFALTDATAGSVAQIVRKLEGLPLAIELAAARVRALPLESLLQRLDSRLRLLTTGGRDADQRQRTLRATIEWSHDLLSEQEQMVFRRLGIFVGGCRLEAAEAVCDVDGTLGIEVFEGVAALVDKSLLRQRSDHDRQPRYWMLETIREYALGALGELGEAEELQRRHAEHFCALAEEIEVESRTGNQAEWFARLDSDVANVRAALAEATPELRDRLVSALWPYWFARGGISEGLRQLEAALASSGELSAHALVGLCMLRHLSAYDAGDVLEDAHRAADQAEREDDQHALAEAWSLIGRLQASALGQHAAGERAWERALDYAERGGYRNLRAEIVGWLMVSAIFSPLPTDEGVARCLRFLEQADDDPTIRAFAQVELAALKAMRSEFDEARVLLDAGHKQFEELGLNVWAANNAQEGYFVHMLSGDPAAASAMLEESYAALEQMGERGFLSTVAAMLAHALYEQRALADAARYTVLSQEAASDDDAYSQILWRTARAKVYAREGRVGEAEALARQAVALADQTDLLNTAADAYADLSEVLEAAGRHEEALLQLREAERRYEEKQNLAALARIRDRRHGR